jgi:KaiC/GvpD/RAD55 family RecA-like ATPase
MQIPGISDLLDKGTIPDSVLLLTGPAGAGKSMYCRQFFADGLFDGDYCIYVSSNLTDKQFRSQFSNIEKLKLIENSKFINPYLYHTDHLNSQQYSSPSSSSSSSSSSSYSFTISDNKNEDNDDKTGGGGVRLDNDNIKKLSLTLAEIRDDLIKAKKFVRDDNNNNDVSINNNIHHPAYPFSSSSSSPDGNNRSVRLIVDSLTHLLVLFGQSAVLKFVNDLSFLLKEFGAMAIFTLTTPLSNEYLTNALSSIFDGIIEMKLEEHGGGSLTRSIRLLSIKGLHHNPSWINFKISDDGSLAFADQSSSLTCMLCGKSILGTPIFDSEFTFDSQSCLETYKKLAVVYGSNISEIGLPSEVVNVNFFFIDIVSLSDPSLSIKKQREKIEVLNKMIGSCDAYFRTPRDKKIILPTGDGMAIGFLLNIELPFQLSIQLHRKLRAYNRGKSPEEFIGVRIGLSSGPVFVVNDINDRQNVWGPGIILARRVMDIGDNYHILLAERIAEELIALKDEYRASIKPVVDYQIKHGQTIKLYSAFSKEFGNPKPPAKIIERYY